MKKKLSRREMLKLMGGASSGAFNDPFKAAFAGILTGIINKAYAAENPLTSPRNYILLQLIDAPSRWTWDPLTPFDDPADIVSNRNVATNFVQNASLNFDTLEYRSVNIHGINMPWLWQFDVPSSTGGGRNISELMDYMLMIKGVNVINPDHFGALDKQFRPGGISHTITSINGDVSERPIPFIGLQTSPNPYLSKIGKAGVNSLNPSGNWLENLLKPFNVKAGTFESQIESMDSIFDQVFANIEKFLKSIHSNFDTSTASHRDALSLIKRDFGDLSVEFTSRRNKYRTLLQIATSPMPDGINPISSIEGINTKPIMIEGVDLRDTLKSRLGTSYIHYMAEQFAVIEYVLHNKLTTSVAAGLRSFNGYGFDEHLTDPKVSTYTNTLWNRGLAACLLELIDQLKVSSSWDDTVISIQGEFGRNPKGNADGSDHAPEATSITLLSGSLIGNEIVGNTKRETGNVNYPGTWGSSASNGSYGFIETGHVAATIASLLKVESPVTSSPSLVKVENGKIRAKISQSKLV